MPFIPAAIGAVASAGAGAVGAVASGVGAVASGVGSAIGSVGAGIGGALSSTAFTSALPSLATYGAMSLMMRGSASQGATSGAAAPQVAALPAAPSVEKAKQVADRTIENKRKAISRNKTIFTGPLGITEEEKSGLNLKTLLGT